MAEFTTDLKADLKAESPPIGLGIVGLGMAGAVMVHAAARHPGFRLAAAADPDLAIAALARMAPDSELREALRSDAGLRTRLVSVLGVSSALSDHLARHRADWRLLAVLNAYPIVKRGGVIFPIEDGRWLVTLVGVARDYPATDEAGFLDFAKSLLVPEFYEALQQGKPTAVEVLLIIPEDTD